MADLKFTDEDDDELIVLIKAKELLYDPKNKDYKDLKLRDHAWSVIAIRMKKTDAECRKRWKYIRDSYNRYKCKGKSCTDSVAKSKNTKRDFYERLSFLDHIQEDTEGVIDEYVDLESESMPVPVSVSPPVDPDETDRIFDEMMREYEAHQWLRRQPKIRPNRSKKLEEEFFKLLTKIGHNRLQLMKENKKEDDNEDYSLIQHIRIILKKLPPTLKIRARIEMYNLLAKYENLSLEMQVNK